MFQTHYNYKKNRGENFVKPSRTVPDLTYTIQEMFAMQARGIPIPDVRPLPQVSDEDYGVTEENFDDLDSVSLNGVRDLTDIDELQNDSSVNADAAKQPHA